MSSNLEIQNSFNDIFGVKHYNVKIVRKKENIFKFTVSVLSYALFIWLLLIGGTLLMLGYTFILNNYMNFNISYVIVGIASVVLSIIGQIGDFSASVIKRYFEVKDFSNIFPGHGGMLDRIDSVMFIAPFAYMMCLIIL